MAGTDSHALGGHAGPAGARLRPRQDGRRRSRPARSPSAASSSSRPAARPRISRRPGSPSPSSRRRPGFPEILGGRVKTLHPKIFGGVLADDTRDDHARDLAAARDRADRPRRREPLPVREDRRRRQAPLRGRRDDRHRRPGDDPRRRQEPRARRRRRGPGGLRRPSSRRSGRPAARSSPTRERLAARAFARTAAYDAAIAGYFAGSVREADSFPENLVFAFDRVGRAALRREPAPARRALRLPAAPPERSSRFQHAPGQGALLQQPPRPRRRASRSPATSRARRPSSSSTTTPAAPAIGDTIAEAFGRAFACDPLAAFGGIIAIRGTVDGALAVARAAALRRGRRGRRLHRGGPRPSSPRSPTSGCSESPCRAAPAPGLDWKRIEGGLLAAGRGLRAGPELVLEGRLAAQADSRRAGRLRARLESRAPREVQRDRARQRPPDDRHRRRADEPRGRLPPRRRPSPCSRSSTAAPPPTLSSRSATASTSSPTPASPRSWHPGGSIRDQEIIAAADERNMAYLIAPRRHFRH